MKTILILTEDKNNKSVQLLEMSLIAQSGQTYKILVIEKKAEDQLVVYGKALAMRSSSFFPSILLRFDEIALVMVRTWTEKREPVLALYKELVLNKVPILDKELIPWTLSKVDQYYSARDIYPISICLDTNWMTAYYESTSNRSSIMEQITREVKEQIAFPLVAKTSRGSRGTGVYRVDSETALIQFLTDYLNYQLYTSQQTETHGGIILQKFIEPCPSSSLERSTYFRVNIINQNIHSVVQFQLGWKLFGQRDYYKLDDTIENADDKPVQVRGDLIEWYKHAVSYFPYPLGVVGLDIMISEQDTIWLLEANTSPTVSLIEDLGSRYADTEQGKQCQTFSSAIAEFCLLKASQLTEVSRKRPEEVANYLCNDNLSCLCTLS